ncbi:hypothetical protein pb186bvf_004101 [Paramecium bursaria]
MRPQTSSPHLMNRQEIYVIILFKISPSILNKVSLQIGSNHISNDFIFIKRPKFYVSKQQQDQNKEMMKGFLRDAPNSREFKKTIPNNMTQDKERLYEELNKSKQLANQLQMDNYQLRVQVKSLEQVLQKQLASKVQKNCKFKDESSEIFPHSASVAIPQAQKRILSDIPQLSITVQLKKQIKDLKDEIEEQQEDMLRIKRNAKLTKIQEMEAELKQFQEECIRLKNLLHQQLLKNQNPSQDEMLLEDKYLLLQENYQRLEFKCNDLMQKLRKSQEEYKKQSQQYYDLEQNYQKTVKDKTQLKKDLQDLEEQFNKAALNDPLFRRGQDVSQIKIEFERKLVECNQLKNDSMIKDKRINELERQLKDITHNYQDKLNNLTKEKEQFKEKWEKSKQELIELQDKYQQLFFNSNRNLQPYQGNQAKEIRATNQSQEDLTPYAKRQFASRDAINENISKVSFQEQSEKQPIKRRTLQRKLSAIKVDDVEEIITQLRYKLRAQDLRAQELEIYLFNNKDQAETTLGELIQIFQKKPFDLNQNECVTVARYLIEPYGEKEITFNINLAKDNESILKDFIRCIGQYSILLGDDKLQAHELIRQQLNQKKEEIMNFLKPQKKNSNPSTDQQVQNQLPSNLCTRQQFKTALVQTSLTDEQTDILLQQIYETTADFNFVDLDVVWNTWPATGQIQITRHRNKDNNSKQLSQEVVECLDHLLEYAQQKGYSILDMRKIMDEDGSGYIERAELKLFLSKCNIILEEMQLMQVFDHFDQEGDGRISINDIGNSLKQHQQRKQQEQKEQGLHKKTPKQLLNLVAQHFIQYMSNNKVDLFQIFVSIDADGQGSISKDEFKQMLRSKIIIPLDQEEYNDFFKMIDSKEDGQIAFQDFQSIMIPEVEKITGKPYHEFLSQQLKS